MDLAPVIHPVFRHHRPHFREPLLFGELDQHRAHAPGRSVLNEDHVLGHHGVPVLCDELTHQADAGVVGCNLSPQVRHRVPDVPTPSTPGDLRRRHEKLPHTLLLEASCLHDLEAHNGGTFLHQRAGRRRHRPRGNPPHVRVVPTRRHEEHNLPRVKHGCYHRNIRKMRPPRQLRVVRHQHVPLLQVLPAEFNLLLHGITHGSQVDWHVGGVGHQAAVRGEQGAGEVQPLLDVHADARALEGAAHLLGDAHETVGEDPQHHWVQLHLAVLRHFFLPDFHLQIPLIRHHTRAPWLNQHSRDGLDNHSRPVKLLPGLKRLRQKHRRLSVPPLEVNPPRLHRRPGGAARPALLGDAQPVAHGPHPHVVDDNTGIQDEPELALVLLGERCPKILGRAPGHYSYVGALVSQIQVVLHTDILSLQPLLH
mmetsp:Transcript_54698/g.119923  ORF Transcript_54698/g.119923 Transcript_54698/m.119923 type:complete len:423 (+) Transcript_54698:641-1909(+)